MKKPERLECCDKTFDTVEDYKSHREDAHRRLLPLWCKGIMGGCIYLLRRTVTKEKDG